MKITKKVLITVFSYGVTTIVGFLGTLYFTNTLGATQYGKYVLGLTIVKWLIVSDLGFRKATKKRVSEGKDIEGFYTSSLIVHLVQATIIVGLMLAFKGRINGYIGGDYTLVVVTLFVTLLASEMVGMGLTGIKQVHVWKSIDAFSHVMRVAVQFGFVVLGYEVAGLLLGHALALGAATLVAAVFFFGRYGIELDRPQREHLTSLLKYAKFSWLGRLRSQTFAWMDMLILGFFVTSSVVATYQVAWTISMVFGVLSGAIAETLFPELSALDADKQDDHITELITEGFTYAGFVPIPALFGTLIIGSEVLALFGPEFTDGTPVLVTLTALSIILSFDNQLRNAIDSLNYPRYTFVINFVFVVTNLLLNALFIMYFGALGAAVASLFSLCLSAGLALVLLRRVVDVRLPLRALSLQFAGSAVMVAVVWPVKRLLVINNAATTVALAGFGAAVYFSIMVTISGDIREKTTSVLLSISSGG